RMYRLIKGREAIPSRPIAAASIGQGAHEAPMPVTDGEVGVRGLPLGRINEWRWLMPAMAACLLVAAGLAIWLALSKPAPMSRVAEEESEPVLPVVAEKAPELPPPVDKKKSEADRSAAAPVEQPVERLAAPKREAEAKADLAERKNE